MSNEYDVVVLGGGTGGYVAAIRASQLGMKVAVVEKDKLGGTCLHRGCIPSKALLRSAEVYHTLKNGAHYGVEAGDVGINFLRMQERKQEIVSQLHKGVQHLMKQGKIDVYEGTGRIMGPSIFSPQAGAITVEYKNGESEILVPKFVLIATGSRPRTLPGLTIDKETVITSDEALELTQLPKSVLIIGGGVIGIEWASLFNDLGVDVEIVEYADRILPLEDEEISKEMARLLKKRKIKVHTGAKILPETLEHGDGSAIIKAEQNGKEVEYRAEKILVSVGRQANIEDIGLNNVEADVENGSIKVNERFQTKEAHIYAIGDVIGGLQLAHVASHEGIIAVEHMAGQHPHPIDYTMVPKCTYSRPEVANVGLTEVEAKAQGYSVKTGKFNFRAIGKALVYGEYDGFVKIVVDEKTDDVLGVHMIGPHVTDLIAEGALARVLDATPWEIAHTIHPHPTLSEIMGEAALAVDGKAIHS
ncbi:dihydrolipoyl dehydrogenase [Aneurinibacillus migulanus]|uniref:Dihydrolipoyl dehydrogenase n=1 Tax=Aneurinibacillus migulanus TaxID=47500 RepID=A0A0D1UY44_ANEMI|nr:dihydrolipoyl dehydrogenase [Aneurinibacillus migulanus]KIV51999.1 dihydrolipoamide dehydrogenase [Aneurinibacillus migulanus]KON98127.1 dihydrolipoamide dehydrogenase [Aneurinibacillus migulanus]MED0891406.1 dihydrolipoyl dehydrogenase [Aneurinibacillus migulanus]MED1613905.1 dihydrolipoyl dehydrogenase [Aneurinibacillus migulanus]SDI05363.1 dihydrolipoamide dehydrogenase [Aneurinibacillus migulanus]